MLLEFKAYPVPLIVLGKFQLSSLDKVLEKCKIPDLLFFNVFVLIKLETMQIYKFYTLSNKERYVCNEEFSTCLIY